ncbi:phage tail protein [Lewinellaceae bacterium SD302]|nr:phage tail protein [Lewinellaceae bacterium SD302]
MAGEAQSNPWPVPKFHFKVTIGDLGEIAFQEVSGLDTELDVIEYRAGNSVDFSSVSMPGIRKGSDVTFKKGTFDEESGLGEYFNEVVTNAIKRQKVTIQLLDETGTSMFTWTLKNAFPMKISGIDLNAQTGEVAVEEIVLVHEGLEFEAA